MNSPKENRVQKRGPVLWLIVFPMQVLASFCISYFLSLPHYPYIPVDLSNRVLSSLIDVSIALFGFVGLILVFTFRNLLTTKGNLQRERLDTDLRMSQFRIQSWEVMMHGVSSKMVGKDLKTAIAKCGKRIKEIDDDLAHNKEQIKKASYHGLMSVGFAVVCILTSVWLFGAVTNEGLYLINLVVLLSFFFVCVDSILNVIDTVIR